MLAPYRANNIRASANCGLCLIRDQPRPVTARASQQARGGSWGINLKPAAAMGMATIKVLTSEQARAELSALLDLEL